ncbi:MAG: HTTM domain-containing protein [Cellvibrio sp.]|nr:HTTM domain-containing protein [Cellvibrio sp.]
MTLELAVRIAEGILAFAIMQQSVEFIRGQHPEKYLAWLRLMLASFLLVGFMPVWMETGLLLIALILIKRFQGPYNGGSDTMTLLVLLCLWLSHIASMLFTHTKLWQEIALGYLAIQLILSYFQAGWVKVINPEWRSGKALENVFAFTAYPVSQSVRQWATNPALMFYMSWAVILFELIFPLTIFSTVALYIALFIAAVFHLANACLFGLNRFFWIWPAAYPILIWFQSRVF